MLDHSNRHAHQLQANALVIYGGQSLLQAVQMYKLLVKHQLIRVITKSCKMLHEKFCLIINMPKIMIINYQQFAKRNTFSLSFHILFSPFLHIFPHFSPRYIEIRIWGWAKMGKNGVGPPPPKVWIGSSNVAERKFLIIKLQRRKMETKNNSVLKFQAEKACFASPFIRFQLF